MTKPCSSCDAYSHEKCGVLVRLQATPPADQDTKAADIAELLFQRPCQFSIYIKRMAKHFVDKRGLRSQVEPEDIHNDVVVELMGRASRWARFVPAYEDFRTYVTRMTRNAVQRAFVQRHGEYCCGACAFYLEGRKALPSRCGNAAFMRHPISSNSLEFEIIRLDCRAMRSGLYFRHGQVGYNSQCRQERAYQRRLDHHG